MSSHAAKLITLAGLVDKCRRLEVFDPKGLPQEHKLQYFQGAKQLANILEGTHRALEQVLDHIWVNQGSRLISSYYSKNSYFFMFVSKFSAHCNLHAPPTLFHEF